MPAPHERAPRHRRGLHLTVLIAALAALFAFAGTAAAETKVGEGTSPEQPTLSGELDLLKGTANYDSTTGTATFEITTRAALESTPEEKRPEIQLSGLLINANFPCSTAGFEAAIEEAEAEAGEGEEPELPVFPIFELETRNKPFTEAELPPGYPFAQAYGIYAEDQADLSVVKPETLAPGSKTVIGTTTTVAATTARAANKAFNCAEVGTESFVGGEPEQDFTFFPLTTKVEPAPVVPTPPPAATPATPAPAPGALSIAKAKKPLKLKVGKSATVKVKVTNTGGSSTVAGSLQLKAAKGVIVKGSRQKLPVLQPGESWTVSYKVKLTAKAKKSSTLVLVGAAGSLTAKGSLVVKALGG